MVHFLDWYFGCVDVLVNQDALDYSQESFAPELLFN